MWREVYVFVQHTFYIFLIVLLCLFPFSYVYAPLFLSSCSCLARHIISSCCWASYNVFPHRFSSRTYSCEQFIIEAEQKSSRISSFELRSRCGRWRWDSAKNFSTLGSLGSLGEGHACAKLWLPFCLRHVDRSSYISVCVSVPIPCACERGKNVNEKHSKKKKSRLMPRLLISEFWDREKFTTHSEKR